MGPDDGYEMVLLLLIFRYRKAGCHARFNDVGGSCPKHLDISGKIRRQGDNRVRQNGVVNSRQAVDGESLGKSSWGRIVYLKTFCRKSVRKTLQLDHLCPPSETIISCGYPFLSIFLSNCATWG